MTSLVILFIVVPLLVVLLLVLHSLLSVSHPDSEKVTSYECRYTAVHGQTRAPFSIRYYLVGILFLVFDLEILLLYPLRVTLRTVSMYGLMVSMLFFIVLTLGFVYEYGSRALKDF